MLNALKRKEIYSIPEYLQQYQRTSKSNINEKYFKVASTTLALILYSEKVMAASGSTTLEPGFWKLVGIIQKIVAGLALLYSYRVLAKMAAKGEGTWKEVGYGLLIVGADYGLPSAFKFVTGLF
ncbi:MULTISPECIES: hypothetical protein [Clostridium]|uniref:Uncharacterized protein n=2 Tax=Clostridium TaxID=1485 RepID=D8GK34_CLOLD|nr:MULTISPECIES: hypothetical protein [Clostridium]ADK13152.1 hypothetical protein CLJU_c00450 [Clostridium ljungdahlii DSM 13528]AGY76376.1 hypothetical protein CAETHG_2163 [Clostridium autoethanogenum DSM 10061]ALU36539.1 Hypothetical protein CLAU_2110 [Clostridium autoethanogenum DSM 10061]OAA84391.1 hypothetical protein WX45_01054 [Clostridium ljungdahlii DSM 13528]OVY48625.1 hypothetical protein WX72_00446 [Clostridium autoethanogenum]